MSVLISFNIFPLDKGESVSEYVARVIKVIRDSKFPYILTPMDTVIETEKMEDALKIIKDCFQVLEKDCNRIIVNIKIDFRKGKKDRLQQKIKSVEEKLESISEF